MLDVDMYQEFTRSTAIYPKETALDYLVLGLASEAGEVAGKRKKAIRDGIFSEAALVDEVGDVLWYAARILDELGWDMSECLVRNRDKLIDRQNREVIKGSGDNR
jgi:NTP pyrophosphatase (non-canonical NTP hydrolase)